MDAKPCILAPAKRILLVECARGAAAVYVCLGHVIMIGHLAESFKWGKFLFYPLTFGPEAVYLFFFLSGFSIHYSSHNRPLETLGGMGHYYFLRLRRIYPIFLVAVGLAMVLGAITVGLGIVSKTPCHPAGRDLSLVLLFLSDYHTGNWYSGLANNPALWSLSYEIPYYLAYPAFWWGCKKIGVDRSFGVSVLLSGVFILAGYIQPNHVSNVLSLYWLWTGGVLLAEWKLTNRRFSLSPVGYLFLLFLSYAVAQSAEMVVNPLINWNLKALTIGMIILSTFIDFRPLARPSRLLAVGGMVFLLLVSLLATRHVPTLGRHMFLDARLVIAAGIMGLLLLTGTNLAALCRMLAKPFLTAGPISYALYVVHMPILYFMADVLSRAGASGYWLLPVLLPIFFLAWWLEIKFQARVAGWLSQARVMLTSAA